MADGGFLVKFNGKEVARCHTVAFDYDTNEYEINKNEKKALPPDIKTITIDVENA